jgi:5-(carboxyamino)imidazole ribonucleotide synthase
VTCVLEQRLALAAEISVVRRRGAGRRAVALPVQENVHRDGILALTRVPAPSVAAGRGAEAVRLAGRIAEAIGYVGVLCVEFFVLAAARSSPTRWRRGRTTRATTASTPATCRSSTSRCGR